MTFALKRGVSLRGIRAELFVAILALRDAFEEVDEGLVLTSCTDGRHGGASLHYLGCAVDCRISGILPGKVQRIIANLRERLNEEWDTVLEADHIHVEFQPK